MVYFTSDPHYGHVNIVRGISKWEDKSKVTRDFNTLFDMNKALVDNINNVIQEDDILYCLGDWSFGNDRNIEEFRTRINCKNVHLVLGNHDKEIKRRKTYYESLGTFSSINDYLEIEVNKQKIILSHYGMKVWNKCHRGTWQLYGHSHGRLEESKYKQMDVGVDTNNLKPYSFDDIKKIMDTRQLNDFDMHVISR